MSTPRYGTYAFENVVASISGPGGQFTLSGPETAAAEEAITITWGEEMNTATIGADGSVMNSMHSARAGTCTFRLMKTSPLVQQLVQMITFQHQSSAFWGRNTITIRDTARGDAYTLDGCAWKRFPTNSYAKIGNVLEFELDVALIDSNLGPGTPDGH
jgi:hypothetical protein